MLGDVIGVKIDLPNNQLHFSINGLSPLQFGVISVSLLFFLVSFLILRFDLLESNIMFYSHTV